MTSEDTDAVVKSVLEKHRAVVLDFSSEKYDFFKYNGKTRLGPNALKNKGVYWTCVKLAKQHQGDDLTRLFVVCVLNNKTWIGNATDEVLKKSLADFIKTNQSLGYVFNNEIIDMYEDRSSPFKEPSPGELPEILKRLISGKMSLQVASVLDKYVGFSDLLDKNLGKDHVIWSDYRLKVKKLHRYLDIDASKIKTSLNNVLIKLTKE